MWFKIGITGLGLLLSSCGATVKHKASGETHHYLHIEVNANVDVIVEACKEANNVESCIIGAIEKLTDALTLYSADKVPPPGQNPNTPPPGKLKSGK